LGSRLVALAARERYGFDERVDGGETMGNSLGRAPLGGNGWKRRLGGRKGGVTTGWTEGKPWEIAWGELRWEGAIREDRVDGRETVGNSLGSGRETV